VRSNASRRTTPPGVARIWGELDDGRDLEDVIVEESRRGCSSLFIDPGVEFVLERDEPATESEQERQFPRCRSYLSDALDHCLAFDLVEVDDAALVHVDYIPALDA
jgi:hypothetical protein